jgi:hypothetical protein
MHGVGEYESVSEADVPEDALAYPVWYSGTAAVEPRVKLVIKYAMHLLVIALLALVSGTAFAQDTSAVPPNPTPAPAGEDVPPGGCMPIGVTAAGEMVFPFQCKEFL